MGGVSHRQSYCELTVGSNAVRRGYNFHVKLRAQCSKIIIILSQSVRSDDAAAVMEFDYFRVDLQQNSALYYDDGDTANIPTN